jgi:hypothetical protein
MSASVDAQIRVVNIFMEELRAFVHRLVCNHGNCITSMPTERGTWRTPALLTLGP